MSWKDVWLGARVTGYSKCTKKTAKKNEAIGTSCSGAMLHVDNDEDRLDASCFAAGTQRV